MKNETELLEITRLALASIQRDANVQQRMAQYGFTAPRVKEGETLLKRVEQWQNTQVKLYDERWSISQQINESILSLQVAFKEHARVARTALRNDPITLHTLKIERIAQARWECIRQADYFYKKLKEQNVSLEGYEVSKKEIQQAINDIAQVQEMKKERTHKKGMAENSTQEKTKALQELRAWMVEFRGIARYAFKDTPQVLEIFGMSMVS